MSENVVAPAVAESVARSNAALEQTTILRVSARPPAALARLFVCNVIDRPNAAVAALQMNPDLHLMPDVRDRQATRSARAAVLAAGAELLTPPLFASPSITPHFA